MLIVLLAATFLIDAAAFAELTHGGLGGPRVLQQQPEEKLVGIVYVNITEGVRCQRHTGSEYGPEASSTTGGHVWKTLVCTCRPSTMHSCRYSQALGRNILI